MLCLPSTRLFLRVLLAIACCIALAFSLLPQAEAAMRADVVTAKVTLNGQVIDNKNAKYPLLSYSNITYFPMTYHLSRFMGVETDWNNASKSLNITAGGAQSAYVAEPGKAPRGSVSVTLPSYKVYINSALSNDVDDTANLQLQRRDVLPADVPLCVRVLRLGLSVGR